MKMNLISVVMGSFNDQYSISSTIESILNQTYQNWEFIIIDDNSTDDTQKIIESFLKDESRIKFYKNRENIGLAATLNRAISISKGDFIARMDADDISLNNRLEAQKALLDSKSEVMVVGSAAIYDDKVNKKRNLVKMPKTDFEIKKSIFKTSPFIHPSVMMRRDFIEKSGGYDIRYIRAQDYELWLRGRLIGQYYNIQEPLIIYNNNNKHMLKGYFYTARIRFTQSSSLSEYCFSFYWMIYEFLSILLLMIKKVWGLRYE
tara:strand:+ start:1440 stop:2222 length:783 start_codon:yes stop_codon:yes gene_type:complete